jgi:predicted MFS family arabinose efflux permease
VWRPLRRLLLWRPRLGLLRDHDFRGLFASTTVSQFGQQVTLLALPLIAVLALDVNEFQIGLLFTFTTAPFLLVGLPAGAWVDRMRRRQVLIVADLARAALLVTIPVAWWLDLLTLNHLYVVALVSGVFTVFFDVAYQSYLPHLIGRDKLVEGNAKLEGVRAVSDVAGPGVAGQLIHFLTAPVALLVDAIALALSATFVARIRKQEEKPERKPDANLRREIAEGLRFVLGHRLLRPIAICTASANFCLAAYAAMEIVFMARVLGLNAGTIGVVFMCVGAGGVIGFFLVSRVVAWLGQGPAIWISVAVTMPFGLLLPLAQPGWTVWLGAFGLFVVAVGSIIYNVIQVSFRQGLTPDHLLGRMNATMRFLVWGTMPLGGLVGGALGQLYGARMALLVLAAVSTLTFLPVFLSPLRRMRELPQQPDGPEGPENATRAGDGASIASG